MTTMMQATTTTLAGARDLDQLKAWAARGCWVPATRSTKAPARHLRVVKGTDGTLGLQVNLNGHYADALRAIEAGR